MPDYRVTVIAGYGLEAACEFDAALRVIEALRTGGMPWPDKLRIEVREDA